MIAARIVRVLLEDEEFDARAFLLDEPSVGKVIRGLDPRGDVYYEDTGTGSVLKVNYYGGRPDFALVYESGGDSDITRRAVGTALVTAAIKAERNGRGTFQKTTYVRHTASDFDRMDISEPGHMVDILNILERKGALTLEGASGAVIRASWERSLPENEEDFDARAFLLEQTIEGWIAQRGYTLYNTRFMIWEKEWNNAGRVTVGRRLGDTYMVALFARREANGYYSTQAERSELPGNDLDTIKQVIMDYERRAQTYPPLPPREVDESEEDFDAREFLLQSSLEGTAKHLGMEWLNWDVWYLEIGPWRLYVDPWKKKSWMQVEVGLELGTDQIKLLSQHVEQQAADEILPQIVNILTQHADHTPELGREGTYVIIAAVGDQVTAVLAPHIVPVFESEDFNARDFFMSAQLPMEMVCLDLDFDRRNLRNLAYQKVIGQWNVYVTPGEKKSVIEVTLDYGYEKAACGMWYVSNAAAQPTLSKIVGILQAHTTENGWVFREDEASVQLRAIPHQQ